MLSMVTRREKLEYIFDAYGEIPAYKKLGSSFGEVEARAPYWLSQELKRDCQNRIPAGGKIHPATLMFQAIRIEVNNELGEIEGLLDALEKKHVKGRSGFSYLFSFAGRSFGEKPF